MLTQCHYPLRKRLNIKKQTKDGISILNQWQLSMWKNKTYREGPERIHSYLGEERSNENEEHVIHKQEAQQNHTDLKDDRNIFFKNHHGKYIYIYFKSYIA